MTTLKDTQYSAMAHMAKRQSKMLTVTKEELIAEYMFLQAEGFDPKQMVIGTINDGGTCSYNLPTVDAYFPDRVLLDEGEFIIFKNSSARSGEYSFSNI